MIAVMVLVAQLACPAPVSDGDYPPAVQGCPAAASGVIYPAEHAEHDRDLVEACRRQHERLVELSRIESDATTSIIAWALGGVALGAAATYTLTR